jgi:hypothetical protein
VTRSDGGVTPARDAAAPRWLVAAAIAGSLAAIALRVLATASAGPLWRDEAGSASTATVATFAEFWDRQWLDSFPLLWQLVLRAWTTFLWNGGDAAIRTLGLLIGTALVPALWWTSRALGVLPLASLAVAATPLLVTWSGVQNRAYGLAAVLVVLLVGAVWRMVERASPARVAIAILVALLAVHTTYHAPVVLVAALAGATVVAAVRRDVRLVAIAAGIGITCAVSLLPYAGVLERTRSHVKIVYGRVSLGSIGHGLVVALEPGGAIAVAALAGGLLLCAWALVVALRSRLRERDTCAARDATGAAHDAALFSGATALVAAIGQVPFLFSVGFFVQPWYYPNAVLVVAIALDVVLQRAVLPRAVRTAAAVAVTALLALVVVPSGLAVAQRQSNLDLVAAYLKQNARPGDLIVVYPWHYGLSFDRYYDGEVPFMTVPDVADHTYHRFDQLAELMRDPERIKPGFRRIHQTLQSGGGVWVVGAPPEEVLAQFPVPPVPSDDDPLSWNDNRYSVLAGLQLRWVLAQSSPQAYPVPPLTALRVRDYENAPLTLYSVQPR